VVKQKGNVYHVKKLNNNKVFYLITDGEKWSHGDTLQEAKEDLVYKVTNKTKDDYKLLTLSSILSFEEAVVCYRVITSACSFGVKDFVKNKLVKVENSYSIETIIEKTIGCYGNETFKNYFN
jgi:16S rRNA U1498 N3-methylase RsmE